MRQTATITAAKPETELVTQFEVASIQVSNPTTSPIAFRQGGTDFPTVNSADFVIPAQSLLRLPAVGNQFAFQFTNVPLLLKGNINSAKITALSINEALTGIGSVQPVARPPYYESERNPNTLGNFTQDILLADGVAVSADVVVYTCPPGRKARIASAQIEFYSVFGYAPAAFVDIVSAAIEVPNALTPANPSVICLLQTLVSGSGQAHNRTISVEYILNPGDEVLYHTITINQPTTYNYHFIMSVSLTEFDI